MTIRAITRLMFLQLMRQMQQRNILFLCEDFSPIVDDSSFVIVNDKLAIIPRDEGRETSRGGINDRDPDNDEGRVNRQARSGEFFVQAAGINNLLSPGMILPDDGSSASNYVHVSQDPRQNIPEHIASPQPMRPRDPAARNHSWAPMVQRMDAMEDERRGLILSLTLSNAREEPSLTLSLGRDRSSKDEQAVETGQSKNNATPAMTQSLMELREYGKRFSLRPPGTEDESLGNALRLPVPVVIPRAGWTGQLYHSGGANILTEFAAVNSNDNGFKFMPFSFNCDNRGHLVPTVPCNQFFPASWKGTDNVVRTHYPFANHGQGLKSLGAFSNDRPGLQFPPAMTNQPVFQASGSSSLFPAGYSAMYQGHGLRFAPALICTGQNFPALPAPFYDKGKGVMGSTKPGINYQIAEDNASSSTGKKDLINNGKVILIPDGTAEFCDETDAVLVPRTASSDSTGNQEQVNHALMQPIHKGKGLLVLRNARRTYPAETFPTGTVRKRKREGARRSGRVQPPPFPADVKNLLSTGVLDGVPVKYATWTRDKVLPGTIARDKILCGCQNCNFTKAINPLDFERHAGGNTKHPNNHIHFPNGRTIYEIVQGLQKIPREDLFKAMETMAGHPLNQEKFESWKAMYQASGMEACRALGAAPSDPHASHP